jgi:putative transcriptional regulator
MRDDLFEELLASVQEGKEILRGEAPASRTFEFNPIDVKRIRKGYKLTQAEFAALLGVSLRTLQNWEQGRRVPEGPARVLLQVAARHPEAVLDTVRSMD